MLYTYQNKTQSLHAWAKEAKVPYPTLVKRVKELGWTIDRALTEPVRSQVGIQKTGTGYLIRFHHNGKQHTVRRFRTMKQAQEARAAIIQKLQQLPSVDIGQLLAPYRQNLLTTSHPNLPTYTVKGRTDNLLPLLRYLNCPTTSFYRLQRQTNLPIQDLLTLLFEHNLPPSEIRKRFKASEK